MSVLRLRTERLVLRLPTAREVPALVDFVTRNAAHLAPWEPLRGPEHFTAETQKAVLVRAAKDARLDRGYRWWMFEHGRPRHALGHIGVSNVVRGVFLSAHLGFALDHEAVGRGLMHEALGAVIEAAFGPLGLHRLEANHLPENERSARLLARLGFERIGLAPRYLRIAGVWRDHVQTQRLAEP